MVLVIGGTGFIGSAIVRELLALGESVRVLSRTVPGRCAAGVEHVAGRSDDPAALGRALAGVSAVVNAAGILFERCDNTFQSVHVDGVRVLTEAMRAAGVRRLVHVSALGAKETSGARYHRSKWRGEGVVRNSGLDWTILRPSLVYGRGDHFVNRFAALFSTPLVGWYLPVFGDGTSAVQPVHVNEVAQAAARAVGHPGVVGQSLDVCGPAPLTIRDLFTRIAEATGHAPTWHPIPPEVNWLTLPLAVLLRSKPVLAPLPWPVALGMGCLMETLLPGNPPLTSDQVLMLEEGNTGDPEPARRAFGLELREFGPALKRQFAA
jgi:NADH dehydrogenase